MEVNIDSLLGPGQLDDAFLQEFLQPADLQLVDFQPPVVQYPQQSHMNHMALLHVPVEPLATGRGTKSRKRRPKAAKEPAESTTNDHQWSQDLGQEADDMSEIEGESPEDLLSRGAISVAEMHRLKNRAAQRRFRQRQKARMQTSASQVQELTAQMNRMRLRQQELEARNRVLEHTCTLASSHIQDLNENQEAYDVQQEMILRDTAEVYRQGLSRPDLSIEELKEQKAGFFIMEVFPAFLARHRFLLETGGTRPGSKEAIELTKTVRLRRHEENRVAAFSQWTLAIYAWNKEEMQQNTVPYHGNAFWQQLLDALELSVQHEQAFVAARRRLLTSVAKVRQQREKLILALGISLLQKSPTGSSKEERELRDNLEAERQAVMDFLFTTIDQTLSPIQEAQLDVACYPWCPDLWHFASLLAVKHNDSTPDTIRSERNDALAPAASMLPQHCSAEMLCLPLLARGSGLQLKRGLASIPVPHDVMASQQRLKNITIAKMKDRTCWEIMRGDHVCDDNPAPSS